MSLLPHKQPVVTNVATGRWLKGNRRKQTGMTAPANTVAPSITGTPQVGVASTCATGTWTGTPTPSLGYQWTVAGVVVAGATSSTYTPVAADSGKALICVVTRSNHVGVVSAATPAKTVTPA
jgi:hypothetical protein